MPGCLSDAVCSSPQDVRADDDSVPWAPIGIWRHAGLFVHALRVREIMEGILRKTASELNSTHNTGRPRLSKKMGRLSFKD